ncbi:RecQ family ATP-dependent DNA helicase [Pseudoscardovia suis]|uniref:RecQ family ATP-dependent DNA helicase n=1 Tax=Pseudoscardovia suis TaxID=987063 RepID=UPI003F96EA2F
MAGMAMADAQAALKRYFGYESFRAGQRQAIEAILSGRDTLAIMPTGAGKSLCYQVPSLLFEGITIVISPLIALMHDQVAALEAAGVPSAYLNSSLSSDEQRNVMDRVRAGEVVLLYCAPERLSRRDFRDLAASLDIALVAVDEAHCVSQWGHDFRPEYSMIGGFVSGLPRRPRLAAFTATATPRVKDDIIRVLGLRDPQIIQTSFDRPNLWFGTRRMSRADKDRWIGQYVSGHPDDSGIIYCASRREVDDLAEQLRAAGANARAYHAGMNADERRRVQEDFVADRVRVIVATNAFGMGIDKPDVRYVIHHNMPGSMEAYYQEAGRAGRDGDPGRCMLLWNDADINLRTRFINQDAAALGAGSGVGGDAEGIGGFADSRAAIPVGGPEGFGGPDDPGAGMGGEPDPFIAQQEALIASKRAQLNAMAGYCRTTQCLRAVILRYFGETPDSEHCGNCLNCEGTFETIDMTQAAICVMRGVFYTTRNGGHGVGKSKLADMLHGSKSAAMASSGLSANKMYGSLSSMPLAGIKDLITQMASEGFLVIAEGRFPVVLFGPRMDETTHREFRYLVKREASRNLGAGAGKVADYGAGSRGDATAKPSFDSTDDAELFEELRRVRTQIAREEGHPPYMVFNDRTLRQMVRDKPTTPEAFLAISGVGERKLEAYGERFMQAIASFADRD